MQRIIYLCHGLFIKIISFFYWLIGKSTVGVRAIVVNSENKVLLVKHTYQPGWYLPGGGVKKGETLPNAIIRELREEAGIEVSELPSLFGIYLRYAHKVPDYPVVYVVKKFTCFSVKSYEIQAIGWFDINQLPRDVTLATQARLLEFSGQNPMSQVW